MTDNRQLREDLETLELAVRALRLQYEENPDQRLVKRVLKNSGALLKFGHDVKALENRRTMQITNSRASASTIGYHTTSQPASKVSYVCHSQQPSSLMPWTEIALYFVYILHCHIYNVVTNLLPLPPPPTTTTMATTTRAASAAGRQRAQREREGKQAPDDTPGTTR